MNKMIVLNHKMNLEYDEVYEYINRINELETKNNLIICPSSIYLETFINNCDWGIGAQNVFYETNGNYTGEISTLQLKSLGVEYCMIGQSERRKYFKEENDEISKKMNACLDSNIMPIVFIGQDGKTNNIKKDLEEILKYISHIDFIVFAYEPSNLKVKQSIYTIEDDINFIYDYLYEKFNSKPNIIYGGDITKTSIKEIINIEKLNGVVLNYTEIDKIENIIKNAD